MAQVTARAETYDWFAMMMDSRQRRVRRARLWLQSIRVRPNSPFPFQMEMPLQTIARINKTAAVGDDEGILYSATTGADAGEKQ